MNNTSKKPFFSIIVPTLNEEKFLPRLLQHLATQTFQNFEVIHVDGSSEDKTVEKAKEFQTELSLKSVVVEARNVSYQRNFGVSLAKSDWVIFMDADNLLPKYFLQGIKYKLEKYPEIDVFTSWLKTDSYPPKHQPIAQIINFGLELFPNAAFGALIGTRIKLAKKLPFNESISYDEDWQFIKGLTQAGYQFKCFKEPAYIYSMRRFEKEGVIKMSKVWLDGRVHKLTKGNSRNFDKYIMEGGSFYQSKDLNFFRKLDKFFRQASKKQLVKAKQIWESIADSEIT
jgi:glycosyltransferase involved in cell wall biosynthesis